MFDSIQQKIRGQEGPFWSFVYRFAVRVRGWTIPGSRIVGRLLIVERRVRLAIWGWLVNQYCRQIMTAKCASLGRRVRWGGDVPLIFGDGEIRIGEDVSIGNRQTWVVGMGVCDSARLTIGDGTTINYQTTISVAKAVSIGKHCLFAGELKIFDNNSHPLDHVSRRDPGGGQISEGDASPVVIEDDVWIGTQCIIMKGVRIGARSVIAAGSVVTKDVPADSVAAGNPARVVKKIAPDAIVTVS